MNELTFPLTHIALVHHYMSTGWRVCAIYPRGQVPQNKRDAGHWIFVPATVKVGDDILSDPGLTIYADPEWAEKYAAEKGK